MNYLPNEMLLEIFSHLSPSDLLAISSVCQNFNEIITKSELNEKLTLHFRKSNENNTAIATTRSFRKLRVGFFKPIIHPLILNEIGSNLIQLEFAFCKLKLEVIIKILWTCPNVKKLYFLKAQLSDVPNVMKGKLPVLVDVDVSMACSDPRIFRILNNCIVRKLTMDHKYQKATGNVDDLQRFLDSQEVLEELTLTDFFRTNLFDDSYLDHVGFKLKVLRLANINLSRTIYFRNFIENNHLDSLEVLEIHKLENCNFSSIIANARNIEQLKIDNLHSLAEVEEVPRLKKLTLFGQLPLKLNLLIHKFPSLERVEMQYCRLSYDEDEFMKAYGRINVPHNFTSLHIIDTTLLKLRTKTIKDLMLKNVKICDDFFEWNQQVEVLHIENCAFDEEILEKFLTGHLKSLTIINENITQKIVDRIKDICINLGILRLKFYKTTQIDLKRLHENRKLKVYFEN